MLVQLQPVQISLLWNDIQHSVKKTSNVPKEKFINYSNALLTNLLSGKFQCWVIYDLVGETRKLHAIGITAIVHDNMFEVKNLKILSLYGYRRLTDSLMVDGLKKIKNYAIENGCENITLDTSISRVEELSSIAGFAKISNKYSLKL